MQSHLFIVLDYFCFCEIVNVDACVGSYCVHGLAHGILK